MFEKSYLSNHFHKYIIKINHITLFFLIIIATYTQFRSNYLKINLLNLFGNTLFYKTAYKN